MRVERHGIIVESFEERLAPNDQLSFFPMFLSTYWRITNAVYLLTTIWTLFQGKSIFECLSFQDFIKTSFSRKKRMLVFELFWSCSTNLYSDAREGLLCCNSINLAVSVIACSSKLSLVCNLHCVTMLRCFSGWNWFEVFVLLCLFYMYLPGWCLFIL